MRSCPWLRRPNAMTAAFATTLFACGGIAELPPDECVDFEQQAAIGPPSTRSTETYDAFGILVALPGTGEFVSVFRQGTTHANDRGVIVLERSSDGGKNWGGRRILFGHPSLDSRNVGGGLLPSGNLVVFWNRYDFEKKVSGGAFYARSDDGGWTWTPPRALLEAEWTYGPVVVMPPLVGVVAGRGVNSDDVELYVSQNDGWDWVKRSRIGDQAFQRMPSNELALAWIGGGELLGFVRNARQQRLLRVHSADLGHTWHIAETGLSYSPRDNPVIAWSLVSPWVVVPSIPDRRMTLWYAERQVEDPLRNTGDLRVVSFDVDRAVARPESLRSSGLAFAGAVLDFGYPSVAALDDARFAVQFHSAEHDGRMRHAQMRLAHGNYQPVCVERP